jgi:hypothetical protein
MRNVSPFACPLTKIYDITSAIEKPKLYDCQAKLIIQSVLFIARIQLNNYCSVIRILAVAFSEDWIEVIAVTHSHLTIKIKKIFFKIKR